MRGGDEGEMKGKGRGKEGERKGKEKRREGEREGKGKERAEKGWERKSRKERQKVWG